ncbi:hypothetical protein K0817_002790 [Microbacterium sp. HD4P20]|uniref:sirohydrochlorin chelatase n=1 Tax=Microbacterium sp. HD4P20 TaxID=2864874 RepID=UPI001C63BAAC|nr:hypothetical protein [Microbacterium sp. HD4P20]MCP2635491.1 hypothetical protein [Microbacterium sp. HD4P20]
MRVVLVGGHESSDGGDLVRFDDVDERVSIATPGRGLHNSLSAFLDEGETVVVLPMTFGRNPTMVADTAKTLRWLAPRHPAQLALTAPFGQPDHLVAWLRTAANRARATDADTALLIVAPPSNAFDEAELHRIAYLVAAHGALPEVAVAIADDVDAVSAAVQRLRRLGASRVAAVPAGFAESLPVSDAEDLGPLMSHSAVRRVIQTRVRDALAALAAGSDGIDQGLAADHDHGYAHSHAFEESQGHGHSHPHAHPHTHADGTTHTHSHADGDETLAPAHAHQH